MIATVLSLLSYSAYSQVREYSWTAFPLGAFEEVTDEVGLTAVAV
jgi:hypothetical protein